MGELLVFFEELEIFLDATPANVPTNTGRAMESMVSSIKLLLVSAIDNCVADFQFKKNHILLSVLKFKDKTPIRTANFCRLFTL